MQASLKDAQGRTVVTIHDDRGEPYSNVTTGVDIKGQSVFQDIVNFPFKPDPNQEKPRPSLVKGQIVVSAQISFTVGALVYVLADVRVVGFAGSTGTIIAAAQLGGGNPLLRVLFDNTDTFDSVVVQARCVVNGTPSSDPTGIQNAIVSAVVDMYT